MDSVCTVSGLVAVGTKLGECLALSMLWERHSYASRCTGKKQEILLYILHVDRICVKKKLQDRSRLIQTDADTLY